MKVLSLFDGISAGQVALERAGIKVDNYFASEIDKYAIQITQRNYPNTIQLGDVRDVDVSKLPKIDLLIGGSPCQGFSFAGAGLAFDDPRSKLFFEYVRILNDLKKINPDVKFLLENVRMKKEHIKVISEYLGVEPVEINSARVSAQNRVRLYWANFEITQPEDKKIYLKDIIISGEVDRDKSYCIDANYWKGGNTKRYFTKSSRQLVRQSALRLMVKECIQVGEADDISGHGYNRRVYAVEGKSPTLNSHQGGNLKPKIATSESTWRKLTVLECERLQTFPDEYTDGVSNTQRYKALGNSWTVDVIVHIFNDMMKG